ncbi:MAG: homoserine dehydrogenase [Rhodobacteraceae bacterium]|nr:homoserine dehydrogenase [Paracoccaceae bacterium]
MTNVSLTGLARDLRVRQEENNPVRIGLIGCGEMGTDIVVRTAHMDGVSVVAIADHKTKAGIAALNYAYNSEVPSKIANSASEINRIIENGSVAITEDPLNIIQSDVVDVIIEATGIPNVGAEFGVKSIQEGKHLVMMNVEADVTIGPILKKLADDHGVIYSLGAGDEPSACMELIEFVTAMGHKVVAAGKGKNNPLRFDAIPDDYQEEALARNMNPRMLVEFVEGSKTMVEMAAIANATGLVPDIPGMHGPNVGPHELAKVLIPKEHGGVLSAPGRVDFSVGKGIAPGVFVIIEAEHPRIHERMSDLKMGEGPYFSLLRPFHLTSLEVPLTCARAVLYNKADMVPNPVPSAEVCAVAKKDLNPGEILGQIGEYDYRAVTYRADEARLEKAVPCGLLEKARVKQHIRKGSLITTHNVDYVQDSYIAKLRAKQDNLIGL